MSERNVTTRVMPESFYQQLDAGIRFPVRVLHARGGIDTCQSCQGGPGHDMAYHEPTIDMIAGAEDAVGFVAMAALEEYGIAVRDVSIVWNVKGGVPYEKLWRVTLVRTHDARADELPAFTHGYWATESEGEVTR